jgi:sugar phosphate permease
MIVASTPPPPPGARKYAMVLITYVACASFHASREAYVAVKGDFQRHLHFPTQLLGLLDTTFLVCYGVGLLFSGSIGARFGNKTVASVGLAATAAVLATHGFLSKGWLTAAPRDADEAWAQGLSLYVPLVALNGLVQSLGFPNLVAVTSGWVDPTQRGLVLGLWSTTGAAGDIIGLNVATAFLEGGGLFVADGVLRRRGLPRFHDRGALFFRGGQERKTT